MSVSINPLTFTITEAQLEVLSAHHDITCRRLVVPLSVYPEFLPVQGPVMNVDSKTSSKDENGMTVEKIDTSVLILRDGCSLHGVHELSALFEGTVAICVLPAEDGKPAKVVIIFGRQLFSNFVGQLGELFEVIGSDATIESLCVEDLFQKLKILLTGNTDALIESMGKASAAKLKGFAGGVQNVPKYWFETISALLMERLQYWRFTDPKFWEVTTNIYKMVMAKTGATAEDVNISEDEDKTYGLGLVSGNFRPLFDRDFKPIGKDIMGIHLSNAARKALELGDHSSYVAWYKATFPPLFKLEEKEEVLAVYEETPAQGDTVLGTRLVSETDLPAATGRTGSR